MFHVNSINMNMLGLYTVIASIQMHHRIQFDNATLCLDIKFVQQGGCALKPRRMAALGTIIHTLL